jgi:hypothetical protein
MVPQSGSRGGIQANLHLVRYEDFTADPASTFASVCSFVDESFSRSGIEEPNPDYRR